MLPTVLQFRPRVLLTAILFIWISLPATSYARTNDPTVSLDHGLDLFDSQRYQNAETTLLILVRSSAFRRLDSSQRSLTYAHIAYSKINRGKEKESLQYIDKALAETKREFGKSSLRYLDHLKTKALALYWGDDRRKAVRIGETMLDILERMDGDYRSERQQVRQMVASMRKINLEEGELPMDLSDFYTACESINTANYLAKADSIMSDYQLIGKDIRPKHKQAQRFKNAYMKNARESSKDRKNRLIYVPDDKHMEDWCVVYPDGKRIDRVILSARDDH